MRRLLLASTALLLLAGPASAAEKPNPTVRDVMLALTIPTSDIIFNVAAPENDPDAYWETVQANALMLAESGVLLQDPVRAVDNDEWMKHAQALTDSAMHVAELVKTRDVDKVFEAGFAVYDVCDACHNKYLEGKPPGQ